jgi:DNA polymerase I
METLITVRTLSQLKELEDYLADKAIVAFDTETTGISNDSEVIGYSVCAETGVAYYVVLSYWDVPTQKLVYLETNERTITLMKLLTSKALLMHNAVFDCNMVKVRYGVDLMPALLADTMIMAHLVDENRRVGLKELALSIFGEDADKEQREMKESVTRNGGLLTKENYELYKADSELIARYGAKDTILTFNLFYHLDPLLVEEGLDKFFYDEESMPLLKGPTYQLNTEGLRVDTNRTQNLKATLEADIAEASAFIDQEINALVQDYPWKGKREKFNVGSNTQLAWLLYVKLGNEFHTLTDTGAEICRFLGIKRPYAVKEKKEFIEATSDSLGAVFRPANTWNPKTKKKSKADQKISEYWKYLAVGKVALGLLAPRYKWVQKFLEMSKNKKLLNTYVIPILDKSNDNYGIIRPSFLQHGTTSGRYSSRYPNFQNLPRDDKRVKECIISRPGKVFVGADQAQLEPRVFASVSQDPTLMGCFTSGEDFYSVVGAPIYGKKGIPLEKDNPNGFAKLYPKLRDNAKVVALATPYGRTAAQQAAAMGISRDESRDLIDKYFQAYPKVESMMLESHELAKRDGKVHNLFGRPRRIPAAKKIPRGVPHEELDYEHRTLLNLAMNHRVQSTGASIMNRAAIAFYNKCQEIAQDDNNWIEVKIVMQVHDELIVECPESIAEEVSLVLKWAMEETVTLPGVALVAEPQISNNIAGLK